MKKCMVLTMAALMVCLLTACGCKHEWKEADCLNPRTCTLCEETEGEALGHSWVEATCEEAKTCTNCGETEGEALGHSWKDATCLMPKACDVCGSTEGEALGHDYGEWVKVDEENMEHTCEICAEVETAPYDEKKMYFALLEGEWKANAISYSDGSVYELNEGAYEVTFAEETCTKLIFEGEKLQADFVTYVQSINEGERQGHVFYVSTSAGYCPFIRWTNLPGGPVEILLLELTDCNIFFSRT